MWRKFLAGCIAAVLTVSLAGCQGEESESVATGQKDTNPDKGLAVIGENVQYDPNHLVNEGELVALDWWVWDKPELFGKFAKAYEEIHPNVTINMINNPWDGFWTKLPLSLQKGEKGPTLFNVHNSYQDLLINYMAPYDIPVDVLVQDFPTAKSHEIDGQVYYTDYGLMTSAIYYNKQMWSSAGLTDADIPKTWDEFAKVAEKLTIRNNGKLEQAGFNFNGDFQVIMPGLHYQYGQNLFAENAKDVTLNNEAMISSAQMLVDFYDKYRVGDKDFGTDSSQSFGQAQTAMVIKWGHFYGYMSSNYPDIEYGSFEIPTVDGDPYAFDRYNGESTPGINKNATEAQLEVAQDFIKFYMANSDLQKELCLNYSLIPANNALLDDADLNKNPAVQAVSENIDRYCWPGPMPSTVENNLKIAGEDIFYNGKSIEDTLQTAEDIVNVDLANQDFTCAESLYKYYKK